MSLRLLRCNVEIGNGHKQHGNKATLVAASAAAETSRITLRSRVTDYHLKAKQAAYEVGLQFGW